MYQNISTKFIVTGSIIVGVAFGVVMSETVLPGPAQPFFWFLSLALSVALASGLMVIKSGLKLISDDGSEKAAILLERIMFWTLAVIVGVFTGLASVRCMAHFEIGASPLLIAVAIFNLAIWPLLALGCQISGMKLNSKLRADVAIMMVCGISSTLAAGLLYLR